MNISLRLPEKTNNLDHRKFFGCLKEDEENKKCKLLTNISYDKVRNLHGVYQKIIVPEQLNNVRFLNKFLISINSKLTYGGEFLGKFEEYNSRKDRLLNKKIRSINYIIHSGDFLFNRVIPKLPITKKIYFEITKGKGRVLSKAEFFGRLYSCGFEITEEYQFEGEIYFVAKKNKEPISNSNPSYGPLIRLQRIGKGGKLIGVYKLRTMHPFSEYLQDYVYQQNELDKGGKFKNDFRISKEGRIFRKFWLDELPMIINLLKGEMKIVGIRPLSKHYFSLYSEELQEKRIETKPGLLPPFYADMPETIEEIMESELKYLEAYAKSPIRTDFVYFFKAFKSILAGARSK